MKKSVLAFLLSACVTLLHAQPFNYKTSVDLVSSTSRTTTLRFTPGAPVLVPVNTPNGMEY